MIGFLSLNYQEGTIALKDQVLRVSSLAFLAWQLWIVSA
jgi:hypothetical protein